jgi:hypothetical protein
MSGFMIGVMIVGIYALKEGWDENGDDIISILSMQLRLFILLTTLFLHFMQDKCKLLERPSVSMHVIH